MRISEPLERAWILGGLVAFLALGSSALGPDPIFLEGFELGLCGTWSNVSTPDACDGVDNDCDIEIDEDAGCVSGDGCCPGAGLGECNTLNDSDCPAVCGNLVVDTGEACDGNCPVCGPNPTGCSLDQGSAATCDLVCNSPITACANGDSCCAFGAGACGAATDTECPGSQWHQLTWPFPVDYTSACQTINVYGITQFSNYAFTTCSPGATGTGDPVITTIVDNQGNSYPYGNDDCLYPAALPYLAGYSCESPAGGDRMSCAPESPGGLVVVAAGVFRFSVTVCPYNAGLGGTAPFIVWWNGAGTPNPG